MATLTPLPLPQSFEDFCALFLLFIAYSTLGWCGEMIYCSVPKGRLCEKRGYKYCGVVDIGATNQTEGDPLRNGYEKLL